LNGTAREGDLELHVVVAGVVEIPVTVSVRVPVVVVNVRVLTVVSARVPATVVRVRRG
jgi:hypothetical protein